MLRCWLVIAVVALTLSRPSGRLGAEDAAPDFEQDVAPLLTKYCAGCHNPDDPEGKLSVASFAELEQGGEHGAAFLAGDAASSRMIRMLTGQAEPKMPPEDNPAPSDDEIAVLKAWIDSGAKGPAVAEPDRTKLRVPEIASRTQRRPVTAVAASSNGAWLAVARDSVVHLLRKDMDPAPQAEGEQVAVGPWKSVRTLRDFPGPVQALHFTADSTRLVSASGIPGVIGHAAVWDVSTGKPIVEIRGHRDTLYDAELSPDGSLLATAGYDRKTHLWGAADGQLVRTLEGHNGAVYDLAFSPDGTILATASADDTCKLWSAANGERLDTLGQPLKEAYCVAFTPDGQHAASAGADNRIRVWKLVSKTAPEINPLLLARFAHEGAIVQMAYSRDGGRLVTAASDRTVKLWDASDYTELRAYSRQPAPVAALAILDESQQFLIGRLDGSLELYDMQASRPARALAQAPSSPPEAAAMPEGMVELSEVEPNDAPPTAQTLQAPFTVKGVVHSPEPGRVDLDGFRFSAQAGQEWVVEVNASRSGSPLDSAVEVLRTDGSPIPRMLLQAVRDSYFTFRGKDASQSDDFRLFNWEEMELNELLYCNGEVVKLWHYPRGPDSGFMIYPGKGSRWGYFDTTPLSHALGEPCYIVEAHPPGAELIPNGLPQYTIFHENDDASDRTLGADSRLFFTAPENGDYLIRLRDVRGQQSEKSTYTLSLRPRKPDFSVTLEGANPSTPAGAGKEFRVAVQRIDGFEGEVRVDVAGLPPGFTASSPIIIQPEQIEAYGVLSAAADAPATTPENAQTSRVTASATIRGQVVQHDVNNFGEIKLAEAPKLLAVIEPMAGGAQPVGGGGASPLEFEIAPGQTIMLKARVQRNGFTGGVPFGNADSGRNLPHGVYVDNIGLNGLLILEEQSEREFFITAAKWTPDQSRLFHLKADVEGGLATTPVLLHVRRPAGAVAAAAVPQ